MRSNPRSVRGLAGGAFVAGDGGGHLVAEVDSHGPEAVELQLGGVLSHQGVDPGPELGIGGHGFTSRLGGYLRDVQEWGWFLVVRGGGRKSLFLRTDGGHIRAAIQFFVLARSQAEKGSAQVVDVIGEPVDVGELGGVVQGVAGGANSNGGVRVSDGLGGNDRDQVGDEGLELLAGNFVGAPVETGDLVLKSGVIEPASQGALGDAGFAGGPGDGRGEREDRQDGLLAHSEARGFAPGVICDFGVAYRRVRRVVIAGPGLGRRGWCGETFRDGSYCWLFWT